MERALVLRYLHECNEGAAGGFAFRDIRTARGRVHATLCRDGAPYRRDFLDDDPIVRRLCKLVAEDLREAVGRAVFFDLRAGELCFVT
jgi:hypothetical protein